MIRRVLVLLAVVSSLAAAAASADEVEELINTLKPSPLDYAAWAGNLLNAVGDLKDSPRAQARLYEKAYELGIKQAKGYPAAIKTARGLLEARPPAAWSARATSPSTSCRRRFPRLSWRSGPPRPARRLVRHSLAVSLPGQNAKPVRERKRHTQADLRRP